MDWLSPDFFFALLSIIVIDLVLAGDNAIVIGMAARNLPDRLQKKAIFWGTAAAVVVRMLLTLAVVWLLRIPFLMAIGGVVLIWIAANLLTEQTGEEHQEESAGNLFAAIRTIVVADLVMGLDNVLAIAGASHGSFVLVVLGLLISVPIMVWGSTIIMRLMERMPWILYVGAGILAWTAARMITDDPRFVHFFEQMPILRWLLITLAVAGVLSLGLWKNRRSQAPGT